MKLSRQQIKERDAARKKHFAAWGKVEDARNEYIAAVQAAIDAYNLAVRAAHGPMNDAIGDYNAVVEEVNDVLMSIHDQLDEQLTNKSEKWFESEAGVRADNWVSTWDEGNRVETIDPLDDDTLDIMTNDDFCLPECEDSALYEATDTDEGE